MKFRRISFVVLLGLGACAPMAEPEAPAAEAPTKREPRHQPLPPAPSPTPEVVYARATPVTPIATPMSVTR